MTPLGWMTAVGTLLMFMALTSAQVQRLPISTSSIYLVVGLLLGPAGFGVLRIDLRQESWFETLTEFALIVSLFVGGLKLRLPLRHQSWGLAVRLAGPVMVLSIAGSALGAWWILGMTPALALLAAATLAPTDPVLASAVTVNDAEDHDRVRFALSGEAGLNDGAAFPFVLFAIELMRHSGVGLWVAEWAALQLLWAIPAGLAIGYIMGLFIGRFAITLRSRHQDTDAPSDFLALALIVLSFVVAERLHALGFLAAFAAGVGLRHAELRVVAEFPIPAGLRRRLGNLLSAERRGGTGGRAHPPAESLISPTVDERAMEQPAVAAGVLIAETLSFGDTLERLLEVLLVVMVGIMVGELWSPRALWLAVLVFVVIRPAAVWLVLRGTRTARAQRHLIGWFGLRGIGSLYYLSYAMSHGVSGAIAESLVSAVITVIAASIVVHGISVTPILERHQRRQRERTVSAVTS